MIDAFGPGLPVVPLSVPPVLPVLPLRDVVLYPHIMVPLSIARDRSIRAVELAAGEQRLLLLLAQRSAEVDDPQWPDLHGLGTIAAVMRVLKLPDGRYRVLVQGVARARVESPTGQEGFLEAKVEVLPETEPSGSIETVALIRSVRSSLEKMVALGTNLSSEVIVIANNLTDAGRLADLAASNLALAVGDAQQVLEQIDPIERLRGVMRLLNREIDLLETQQRITDQARVEIDRSQREYYLRQQLKAIEKELGEGGDGGSEMQALRTRVAALKMPAAVRAETLAQIAKLGRMQADSAEAATVRGHLEWMSTLPWGHASRDRLDLGRARRVLEREHHGLDKVKERILEFLAVRKLRRDARGPILCFIGPPGVGKTSLGRAIAEALGRRFVRLSLGGVHDEAEIRGHRRTYVGAMPGRIIQAIHQAGTSNPVFMIDEVDKIGSDFRGDPGAALLEVLDPEQNSTFRDHYLGVAYDLSRVLFIATGNQLDPIQPAFRDRMEVVRIEGYTEEEKLVIARRHLIGRQLQAHGLERRHLRIGDSGLAELIRGYTREAGLRNLEREIAALCRKIARRVAEGQRGRTTIAGGDLERYLGPAKILPDEVLRRDLIGVAAGLAWTAAGGEVLMVEALVMPGKGLLLLTGQLGEVMKESAQAALSFLRARGAELGIDPRRFRASDLHIHIAEGAIPKDGPSAGVAIAAALCSALTGRALRRGVAMTGEITLRGRILPVGGIKEKVLAARRAGIGEVALPALNRKDLREIPAPIRDAMRIHLVEEVADLLAVVLGPSGRAARLDGRKRNSVPRTKARG